uniref:Protein deacetylase HDAC6 n=1 Tax=Leptobrachium leishanense TaxID=445787 RepID=A0A8C5Q0G5_9ANUR
MASPHDQKPPGARGPSRSPATNPAPGKKPGRKGHSSTSPHCHPSLQEIKKRGHRARRTPERDLCQQLQGMDLGGESAVEATGLVYDERMAEPHCLWDEGFPESPARLLAVRDKLQEYGLMERCTLVPAREASEEELLFVHSPQYVALMKSTQSMSTEELQALADRYDSVYLHPTSYLACSLAVGSVLQLVDKVLQAQVRNGLAAVRPPGHHAHSDKMNGYCMFNQVAVAARYAQHCHGIRRVLIVDWDVHHGQGTQFLFEDDPSVLYFSIHRYENGSFWPHLVESSSSAVGKDRGLRYNINVPWNKTGMKDEDYIAAFLHLLLPVAYEFQPQLVLVAAGFDSVVGDPKGEMSASPSCFAHLTHLLQPLAQGRLILSIEGGYNLRSLADGACAALKILLGDPCPQLPVPFSPCKSALDSISDTILAHRTYWRILQDFDVPEDVSPDLDSALEPVPMDSAGVTAILDASLREVMRPVPKQRTGLVYDEQMMEHYNMWDSHHPECPQRISRIFQRHKELGLVTRCTRLVGRPASQPELQMCHRLRYIQIIEATEHMKPRDLNRLGSDYNSIYINHKSYGNACLAAGSTFAAVEAVVTGKVQNAVCIVRPPGHHAESDSACGFCFFNTVALAARYAQGLKSAADPPVRVLILDWDVHHGNGTQHIFQDDASVLYISIHRYDHGLFFPCSEDASHEQAGCGPGEGFNVNIPWDGGKMGDTEYLMAFHRVVMPIAYEFNPQLVLVSAGFDAARGDPLGGCRVTPEGYAHMTHLLMGLAGGKVVLVLEGGYNLTSISESMVMCTQTLLGDPLPPLLDLRSPRGSALRSVHKVLAVHRRYWRSLRLNVTEQVSLTEDTRDAHSPYKRSPNKRRSGAKAGVSPQPASESPGRSLQPDFTSPGKSPQPDSTSPGRSPQPDSTSPRRSPQPDSTPSGRPQPDSTSPGRSQADSTSPGRSQPDSTSSGRSPQPDSTSSGRSPQPDSTSLGRSPQPDSTSPGRSPQPDSTSPGRSPQPESTSHGQSLKPDSTSSGLSPQPDSTSAGPSAQSVSSSASLLQHLVCSSSSPLPQHVFTSVLSPQSGSSSQDKDTQSSQISQGFLGTENTAINQSRVCKASDSMPDSTSDVSPPEPPCIHGAASVSEQPDTEEGLLQPLLKLRDLQLGEAGDRTAPRSYTASTAAGIPSDQTMDGGSQVPHPRDEPELLSEAAGGDNMTPTPWTLFMDLLQDESGPGIAVPLPWCPHLDTVHALPSGGLDVSAPCTSCDSVLENWVCLTCYQVHCGRYIAQHMLAHHATSGHSVVLSFSDISVWCYACESYVHHEVLHAAKAFAYHAKFGEEMPGL